MLQSVYTNDFAASTLNPSSLRVSVCILSVRLLCVHMFLSVCVCGGV